MSSSPRSNHQVVWVGVLLLLGVMSWIGWKTLRDAKPEEQEGGRPGGFPPSTVIFEIVQEREVAPTLAG